MKTLILTLATGLCLTCASCTQTMTTAQCANADWRTIGFEDGSLGAPSTALAERAASCDAAGQTVDRVAYNAGREEGLRGYCTYETGYQEGYAGAKYHGVCPVQTATAFRKGYDIGYAENGAYSVGPRIGVGVGVGSGGRVGIGTGIGISF